MLGLKISAPFFLFVVVKVGRVGKAGAPTLSRSVFRKGIFFRQLIGQKTASLWGGGEPTSFGSVRAACRNKSLPSVTLYTKRKLYFALSKTVWCKIWPLLFLKGKAFFKPVFEAVTLWKDIVRAIPLDNIGPPVERKPASFYLSKRRRIASASLLLRLIDNLVIRVDLGSPWVSVFARPLVYLEKRIRFALDPLKFAQKSLQVA